MSKADDAYKELIEDIYTNGQWDNGEKVRTKYADGSPAYTKSIFGKQIVFEEGEIPLLTTKHVGWKTAFKEMRLFWILQTVKKEYFEKEKVKVWNEWFLNDDTLGKSYAYQFESRPKKEIVKVKRIPYKKDSDTLEQIKVKEIKILKILDYPIGHTLISNKGVKYNVLETYKSGTHYSKSKSAKIQFLDTGSIKVAPLQKVLNGSVDDDYRRTFCGVGYMGDYKRHIHYSKEELKVLLRKWSGMLERCYIKESMFYSNYGAKGIYVDSRWLSFENFLEDIKYLPQYFLAKEDNFKSWSIDKDYYDSGRYSLDTCVWLTHKENCLYRDFVKPIYAINKNGKKTLYISATDCAIDIANKSRVGDILGCLDGHYGRKTVAGHTFEYAIAEDGYVYRYSISNNQVVDLLNNIKNNSMSRRLMTSFWNDADVKEKALQECAMQTTWNVRDGKLDLLLYSRSVDTALGLPYNWIQYWFLLQLMAKSCGLIAGRFIHQMGNVHYYCRHEDKILEQINANTYDSPIFKFNSDNDIFFNFTLDDISIENYKHNGNFNYEVAI